MPEVDPSSPESWYGMRALTIHEPWASLIAAGHKRIETRGWSAQIPLPAVLAIHAAKAQNEDGMYLHGSLEADAEINLPPWAKLPFGSIVAVATLRRCTLMTRDAIEVLEERNPLERALGFYEPGRVAWVLDEVVAIDPVPARGMQGLWILPSTTAALVQRAIANAMGPVQVDPEFDLPEPEPEQDQLFDAAERPSLTDVES